MYTSLGSAVLTSGESMDMGCVLCPDEAFAPLVPRFLAHKPESCMWHIRRSVCERLDELETRFYIGRVGDEIITNIMTVEARGVGILGHVFTSVPHRRKGACKILMAEQMGDFRRRGGQCLILGTGYDTHPYYIYKGFGFESIAPGDGQMRYTVVGDDAFAAEWFLAGPLSAVDLAWHHWPAVSVMASFDYGEYLRTVLPPAFGPHIFEGPFYGLKQRCEERGDCQSKVLEAPNGAVLGYAALQPDVRFHEEVYVLDLMLWPGAAAHGSVLVSAFDWPKAKVQAYADGESEAKIRALNAAGFVDEAILRRQVTRQGKALDVLILSRG